MKSDFQIVSGELININRLATLLSQYFSSSKVNFLVNYREWNYKKLKHQFCIIYKGQYVGYCAVIPGKIKIRNKIQNIYWWVDLYIDPNFRNLGIYKALESKIRSSYNLKFGIPNKIAMKIHQHAGWNVNDKNKIYAIPLKMQINKGFVISIGTFFLGYMFKMRYFFYNSKGAHKISFPTIDTLVKVEEFNLDSNLRIMRDKEFLQWRYFDSPMKDDFIFYQSGFGKKIILIARKIQSENYIRILDILGDYSNSLALSDLLKFCIHDACINYYSKVTILSSIQYFDNIYKKVGFLFVSKSRFCWHSNDSGIKINDININYADSDNDITFK